MEMPSFATVGEKVVIECRMHQDDHVIEHIQWYKDNQLFYVFVPNKNPPVATFDVPGVQINVSLFFLVCHSENEWCGFLL